MKEGRSENATQEPLLWGLPWEGGQAFVPSPLERGGPRRLPRGRWPASRLAELARSWPESAPRKLNAEHWRALRGLLAQPLIGPGPLLGLDPDRSWPQLHEWLDRVEAEWSGTTARPLPARWARLVAPDWRSWLHGTWTPVMRCLIGGERLVLLADEALPELLDPLLHALFEVDADLSGLCVLWDQRSESVAALLELGMFPEVQVVASETDRVRWQGLMASAAPLRDAPPAADLAFGFGVQATPDRPHLEFTPLTRSCRNLEKPLLRAGENWRAVLEQALLQSFGTQNALGGCLNGSVGQWILPVSHFSMATEWLLDAIENQGRLDPPVPSPNRASKAEFEQVRARALGEGATLIHEAQGSTGKGQNGTLTRQIFTNVKLGSGLSKAPGMTPTLLLSRGHLGPFEALHQAETI